MKRDVLVSVVIDNYNYADYLGEAIDSALEQTWSELEVIVVDDGSTDDSRDIIAAYGDRVRAVLQSNGGQAAAFNAGVAQARGDIICFLDSDDVWFPHKVERVVAAFRKHPEAAWLRHRLQLVDATREPLGSSVPHIRGVRVRTPVPIAFVEGCYPVPTSALAMKADLVRRIFPIPVATPAHGGFPGVDLKRDADAWVAFSAAATGAAFLSVGEDLGLYRRHAHQRYVSDADLEPGLERQIAVAAGVAGVFADRLGADVLPSSIYKHRAVLAAMRGRSLLHPDRLTPLWQGARRVAPLARVSPWLFARQGLALALGAFAPRLWVRKLLREQGFAGAADAE